jgi:hypothetical protein
MPQDAIKVYQSKVDFNANPQYATSSGFKIDLPTGAPNYQGVDVITHGYKVDEMTGAREDGPPLVLEPTLDERTLYLRVWDAAGEEYGTGAGWSGKTAQITFTVIAVRR